MSRGKRLAAFDFDKTITLENTDHVAQDLVPKHITPKYIRNGWTAYMRNIFEILHKEGIDKSIITKAIIDIPPICGMPELIKDLSENLNYDVIIISDSNSYFINVWLKEHKLLNNIKKVFTNPAEFSNGLLKIEMYHLQDWCNLSEKNLCKGQILEDYIKAQKKAGVEYQQVMYVGDGPNDFCPILRLNHGDLAFCREGYKCADLVRDAKDNKPIKDELRTVKADVHLWKTGFDILNVIKTIG
ncbi:hypothetical protein ILUMI_00294 [Ignelater luminosus]|uniref:Phosphatase n=1 Tax=Ignelater luminosus TaxID=2038154 RepID=A0A8K0DLX0_IGNLU|nr:hypothetical protein ILUMI_00294 [Ignelater luminosus]